MILESFLHSVWLRNVSFIKIFSAFMEPIDHGFTKFTTLHPFYMRLYWPQSQSRRGAEKKFLCTCQESNSGRLACSKSLQCVNWAVPPYLKMKIIRISIFIYVLIDYNLHYISSETNYIY
jgi:hypothetical protein